MEFGHAVKEQIGKVRVKRGEIWLVDWKYPAGREQGGKRPAVVLSSKHMDTDLLEIAYVIPGTTSDRRVPNHIRVEPSAENGLHETTFFMAEQLRCVSTTARFIKCLGELEDESMFELEEILLLLLDLGSR